MNDSHFYVTTTLPYVNAAPHIGFALEIVAADIIARYQRLLNKEVIFNTGTDEHGQKIYQQAQAANQDPQEYVDEYAAKFDQLKELLNLSYDRFIRTTDQDHVAAAQEFWKRCNQRGFIYLDTYETKYCVGCELAKTESELENGRCPLHPNQALEHRSEQNYFFKFTQFGEELLKLYEKSEFVKPSGKLNEIKSFVQQGLEDFSISRLKENMPWGVPVPGDETQVMYVWFDALVNYVSSLGWPDDPQFSEYWPGIQLAGKDNLRQQAAMWQAMLMAANLPTSKQILINGFIGVDGQKMSKSLGNVISPSELVKRYGQDASRFLLSSLGFFGEDMDVSFEKFTITYNAQLANGLGNLCARVAKLAENIELKIETSKFEFDSQYHQLMENFELTEALNWVMDLVNQTDQYLSETKPWMLSGEEQSAVLRAASLKILEIGYHLQPFMPVTAALILEQFQGEIKSIEPLFPRLEN